MCAVSLLSLTVENTDIWAVTGPLSAHTEKVMVSILTKEENASVGDAVSEEGEDWSGAVRGGVGGILLPSLHPLSPHHHHTAYSRWSWPLSGS